MALQPEWTRQIEAGTKKEEFRRSFPVGYSGPIFIYESRPASAVTMVFWTEGAFVLDPFADLSAEAEAWVDANGDFGEQVLEEVDEGCRKLHVVPIVKFKRLKKPLTLEEFREEYGVPQKLRMPWNPAQLIDVKKVPKFK